MGNVVSNHKMWPLSCSQFSLWSGTLSHASFSVRTHAPSMFCPVSRHRFLILMSVRLEHVWTCSVVGDCICEMKRVTESGQQGITTLDHLNVLRPLVNPAPTGNRTPKSTCLVLGPPINFQKSSCGRVDFNHRRPSPRPSRRPSWGGAEGWGRLRLSGGRVLTTSFANHRSQL